MLYRSLPLLLEIWTFIDLFINVFLLECMNKNGIQWRK